MQKSQTQTQQQELDKELSIEKSIIGEPARCAYVILIFFRCSEGVLKTVYGINQDQFCVGLVAAGASGVASATVFLNRRKEPVFLKALNQ
jgi:hypothetical protein